MKVEALGAFKMLNDPLVIEGIKRIVSEYHVRNGKKWNDGSVGEIRMSPGELMDLLAFMATPDAESQSVARDTCLNLGENK